MADVARFVEPLDAQHAAPHFENFDAACGPVSQMSFEAFDHAPFCDERLAVDGPALSTHVVRARRLKIRHGLESQACKNLVGRSRFVPDDRARPCFTEREILVRDELFRITEVVAQPLRWAAREQAVSLTGHAREDGGPDERAEPRPEPVFICADAMSVGHSVREPTTYRSVTTRTVSKFYPSGPGSRSGPSVMCPIARPREATR